MVGATMMAVLFGWFEASLKRHVIAGMDVANVRDDRSSDVCALSVQVKFASAYEGRMLLEQIL